MPQESLIGIVYAVSAAASILVLSRAAEGGEELKALLVGHLLFVERPEIIKVLFLYSLVGLVHWLARKPLLAISHAQPCGCSGDRSRSLLGVRAL